MEDLLLQYNNLTDEEKNALLVYKSRLGLLMNDNFNNVDKYYNYYKELLNKPVNMFIRMSVFNIIDFTSIDTFKESLIKIKKIIIGISDKIKSSNITLYRAISIKNDTELADFSKSELISTTMDFNESLKFIINKPEYIHYIYQFNLEGNVIPVPYSLLLNSINNQLILSKTNDQKEVLLLKNDYDFLQTDNNMINIGGVDINMIILDGKLKENKKKL